MCIRDRLVTKFNLPFFIALLQNLAVAVLSFLLVLLFEEINFDKIIVSAGAWSNKIANLFDQEVNLELTKGCIMVFSHRIVSLAINRCRMPTSNDIMCPSGTVSLWGTTTKVVKDPNTTKINPEEIYRKAKKILNI